MIRHRRKHHDGGPALKVAEHNDLQTRLIGLHGGLGGVPDGKLAGVDTGIKERKPDLAVLTFAEPIARASVVTTNEIKAASLLVSEQHIAMSGTTMRAIVCKVGCANA